MLSERLFGDGDGDDDISIAQMDERYADIVELLNHKQELCVCLAMNGDGLHFWLNFDEADHMTDFLAGFAVAVHDRLNEAHGPDVADATIGRIFADTLAGDA